MISGIPIGSSIRTMARGRRATRARIVWLVFRSVVTCTAVFGVCCPSTAEGQNEKLIPPPMRAVEVIEHPGAKLPLDTRFADTSGAQVRLSEFFDGERPVVLTMAYTSCPMLCNLVLRGAIEALPQLELALNTDFRALTILIDPEETTESAAAKQRTLLDAIGRDKPPQSWPFLIGKQRDIQAVADALGFGYAKDPRSGQFAHPAVLFVLTPGGRVSSYLHGIQYPPEQLRQALKNASVGKASMSAAIGQAVMSCFRFDPALRKYGDRIQTAFRIGAGLLLSVLLGLVGLLILWERRRA